MVMAANNSKKCSAFLILTFLDVSTLTSLFIAEFDPEKFLRNV